MRHCQQSADRRLICRTTWRERRHVARRRVAYSEIRRQPIETRHARHEHARASKRASKFRADWRTHDDKGSHVRIVLLVILILLLVGALPSWPYSSGWGYYPSGGLGLVLIVLIVLAVMGVL
jgi:Protein of unknown function (DUF3309)